ncbi:MAG: hypothetical protein RIS44_1794 [Pseudomonadota bacterium]
MVTERSMWSPNQQGAALKFRSEPNSSIFGLNCLKNLPIFMVLKRNMAAEIIRCVMY